MRNLLTILLIVRCYLALAESGSAVLVVLGGGLDSGGMPHETVMRRIRRAANIYKEQSRTVICNGGGTTHKPRWKNEAGFAVPEAAIMARELVTLGVNQSDIYVEGYSDDTIGNAFFARTMHFDIRPAWGSLRVITSSFQMERTKHIYDWVFKALLPFPAGKPDGYTVTYEAVADTGALPERALHMRRRRENASLATFLSSGEPKSLTHLAQAHEFIFQRHSGYTATGYLFKTSDLKGAEATIDSY